MRKIFKIISLIVLVITLLLGGVSFYFQTTAGQAFLTQRVVSYLKIKLNKPFNIAKITYKIPDWIELQGVYFSDNHGDTLLAGQRLYVDVDMWGLLHNRVAINAVNLQNIKVNIKRTLPDTAFNFAYILKAFETKNPATDTAKGVPFLYQIGQIKLQNVAIKYLDDLTGIDAKVRLDDAQTSFDDFNPAVSKYHLNKLALNGGNIDLRLYPAVAVQSPSVESVSDSLDLAFSEFEAKNIKATINQETAQLVNEIQLGQLRVRGEQLDLSGKKIHFKTVELYKTDASVRFLKRPKAAKSPVSAAEPASDNWQVRVDKVLFDRNNIQYQDLNQPFQKRGLDYNNLKISNLKLNSERLFYSENKTSGWIYSGSFKEKSGFELQQLQTDFAYTNRQTFLKKLLLKTPQSILRDEFVLNYASLDELTKNIGKARLKTRLQNSQLAFKDILLLAPNLAETPPFKGNEKEILKLNGTAAGTVNNLTVSDFSVRGFDQATLKLQGQIVGLPDVQKTTLDLTVNELLVTKNDLLKLAPKGSIPASIELPQRVSLVGKINGKIDDLTLNTTLKSDLGGASFAGNLKNMTATKNQQYDGVLAFDNFEMGRFLKQPDQIGKVTLSAAIKGVGIDPKTMTATIDATVQAADFQKYNYQNATLKGSISNQIAQLNGHIKDPNIALDIDSKLDLSTPFPRVEGNVKIAQLNLKPLGFYAENLGIRGNILVNMPDTNPENPSGTIVVNDGVLLKDDQSIPIEKTTLTVANNAKGKEITIDAPFLKANLSGHFNYLQLSDVLVSSINRYFVLPDVAYKPVTQPYDLTIDATFAKHPILQAFLPGLSRLDASRLTANLNNQADTILTANLSLPYLEYDTIQVVKAAVELRGDARNLRYKSSLDGINLTDFSIRKTTLTGDVSNNTATFNAVFKDSVEAPRHAVAGILQSVDNQYRVRLKKGGLLLNYAAWQVDSSGFVQYGKAGLLVNNFNIENGPQKLTANSTTDQPNGPVGIESSNLDIQNFITLFGADSTLAGGKIDGKIVLRNYVSEPFFTGDVAVKDFRFQKTAIGDLEAHVFNETANKITVRAALLNQNNDLLLTGNYNLKTKNALDLNLIINKLSAETVQAFSLGQLRRAQGNLNGQATIKGAPTSPQLVGNLNFSKVGFEVAQLGSRYLIDDQKLLFEGQIIRLKQFTVTDTLNQPLKVNGTVGLSNIPLVKYDLTIDTKNFMALNSTRKDNDFFYGKGIIDANLSLQGVSSKAKIEGDIKIREKSAISVIVPSSFDQQAESEGVVVFINKKKSVPETAAADSLTNAVFANDFVSEISLNVEADDKSEFTIVVDEINGDNLKVKGNARLNVGLNAAGQPFILGSYDLTEGSYGLTFEVLKRQFSIQKGSNITWTGDPMNADLNITAIYTTNTAPLDLMQNEVSSNQNIYRQKMNFEVLLTMAGRLSSPNVSFNIRVADKQNLVSNEVITNVKSRLNALEINDINKQVFALLVLNRFFSEKSTDFFSSSGGGVNAEAFARQSVSKILSDQLGRFASDLIKGVNLDINLASTQDFFNGESSARTDLSLGLSKAFFNDKIEVKVGRNFELENTSKISRNPTEVFDNITVNYKLTDDGRYLFRAFRKNQFQSVLEGFIVETGLGFSVTMDYGRFKEAFQKKAK